MTYIEFVGEIVKYAGVPALVAIGLKASFDTKLENLKSDLNYLKSKESFKFTKLHEIRLEVLRQTYEHLNCHLVLLSKYVATFKEYSKDLTVEESEKVLQENFIKGHNDFSNYLNANAIYFNENIENLLSDYFVQSKEIFHTYSKKTKLQTLGTDYSDKVIEEADSVYHRIEEIIVPIKKEIEIKFRELLGE